MFIQDAQYWSWEQYVYFISFRWSVILLRPSMYGIWEAGTWEWSMSGQNIYPVHNALHLLAAPYSITQMLQFDHDERKSFGWKFYLTLNFRTKHFWVYLIKNIVLHFNGGRNSHIFKQISLYFSFEHFKVVKLLFLIRGDRGLWNNATINS